MFESIGKLVVLGICVFLFFRYIFNKENKDEIRRKKAHLNPRVAKLIQDYEQEVKENNKKYSDKELNSRIKNFLDSQSEEKIYNDKLTEEFNRNLERENFLRLSRKVGYKYEDTIFSFFGNEKAIHRNKLYNKVAEHYGTEPEFDPFSQTEYDETEEIIENWLEHRLIQFSYINENYVEIGYVLKDACPLNEEGDMTWEKWIATNNIVLKRYPETRIGNFKN